MCIFLKYTIFLKRERNAKSNHTETALITYQMTKLRASVNTQCVRPCGKMGTPTPTPTTRGHSDAGYQDDKYTDFLTQKFYFWDLILQICWPMSKRIEVQGS